MGLENIRRSVFTVNIHCEGCAETIRKGIITLDGVKVVIPIIDKRKISVEYDERKVNSEIIKEKIRNLGYNVD